jgi:hypothetical protein
MASYKIDWKLSAEKELRSIDSPYIHRILEAVESLAENPFPTQQRKLYGMESSHRIRIGDYEREEWEGHFLYYCGDEGIKGERSCHRYN